MQEFKKGKYTGKVNRGLYIRNTFISVIHYYPEKEITGMHYHENAHLCMLLQGKDREQRNGLTYERNSGEVFFYPAGQVHASITQDSLRKSLVIEFEDPFLKTYGLSEPQMENGLRRNPYAKFQLLKLLHELEFTDNTTTLLIEDSLLNLFGTQVQHVNNNIPKWNKLVTEVLWDNWNQSISLEYLSIAVQVHPVTISKYFFKYNHCTLGEYIRRIRIEKSIPLIKNTELKLVQIAYHCGFADQSHFIRVFKETTGFLPGELRKI
jgi:AraC family transcriptional regulator